MKNPIPYSRKPHFYETDQMGIIHHANYIRWFEEARVDYMDQLGFGYKKTTETGIDIAVLAVECRYKSMVRFGDEVNIALKVTELNQIKISLSYEVTDAVTGDLRCTGSSEHCFYDSIKKRPVSLKKSLPELYTIFEEIYGDIN